MNQSTRQRIVGTVVLVLIAVILLPAILDGRGVRNELADRQIPPAPEIPERPMVNPERPTITADTDAIRLDEQAVPESPIPESVDTAPTEGEPDQDRETPSASDAGAEVAREPGLDARGLPEAWSIQLGAFSNQANVERLVAQLQDAGHPAYTRPINTLTGVYVGPKVDRGEADRLLTELEAQFGLSGRVVQYQIEEQR